ncbi:MAG: Uma2 family endonuclease [Desulfococcaceae bacterium]
MAEPLANQRRLSKEEYLEMEIRSDARNEFVDGEIFAMAGGSPNHSTICFNLIRRIGEALDATDCRGFEGNMKLEIVAAEAFLYPDIMVVCGAVDSVENRRDAITNPVLIVEVLSPGTESFDRGRKFKLYQMVPSLQEYVLVSQEEPTIETFFKQAPNRWLYTVTRGFAEALRLHSLKFDVAMSDIYRKVDWMAAAGGNPSGPSEAGSGK